MKRNHFLLLSAFVLLTFLSCSKKAKTEPDQGITTYTNVKLGNQKNTDVGSFINLATGKVYKAAEAFTKQNEIDLVFLHDAGFAAIVSPAWVYSSYPNTSTYLSPQYGLKYWSSLNHTELDICENSAAADFTSVENYRQLQNLLKDCGMVMGVAEHDIHKDDIIRFKTPQNKWGVIKINKVQGNESVSGFVEVDIKIQN